MQQAHRQQTAHRKSPQERAAEEAAPTTKVAAELEGLYMKVDGRYIDQEVDLLILSSS